MAFSCDISKREFAEKHNLTRHMKNQHGNLWFNRHNNYEMHQRICLFKTTGKWSGEHLDSTAKKLRNNISRVGGVLNGTVNGTVNEYRLNLEDEQQDASNVLDVLKESSFSDGE